MFALIKQILSSYLLPLTQMCGSEGYFSHHSKIRPCNFSFPSGKAFCSLTPCDPPLLPCPSPQTQSDGVPMHSATDSSPLLREQSGKAAFNH